MIRRVTCPALLATLLLATSARSTSAQVPPGTGFEGALRLGYVLPFGHALGEGGGDLADAVEGVIPIWADLGYRVLPELFVGAYGQYGFGVLGENVSNLCADPSVECSLGSLRVGLQLHYHPLPRSLVDPWFGLGFGYEWLFFSLGTESAEIAGSVHGFELLQLQAGLAFSVSEHFALGPALGFAIAQFRARDNDCSGGDALGCDRDGEIEDKALHQWLMLGVRGSYAP